MDKGNGHQKMLGKCMEFSIKKLKYKLESNIFCTELENIRIAKVKNFNQDDNGLNCKIEC